MSKIAITGASGFVGRQLVPILLERDEQLLLIGRDPLKLARMFPDVPACGYDQIVDRADGFDTLLHLAVMNNDSSSSRIEFMRVNVDLLKEVAGQARQAGIKRFVNVSSVHALNDRDKSSYAESKRRAISELATVQGMTVETIYLAPVYSSVWAGKLGALNKLPKPLARIAFSILSALKPTVHVSHIADFLTAHDQRRPQILSDGQSGNLFFRTVKRLIDLAAAVGILILFWWGLLVIWLLIRLQSPGPGIFAQERIGRDGAKFTCYKFRTMTNGTAQVATHEVGSSSITKLGRFLRRTKLDELPQVWNILKNEMSLVGPRPCLPSQGPLIEARESKGVLSIKPGITGLAQVNGIDMSDPELLATWDARYLALQSLLLDLKILIATVTGSGQGDRVRG